MYYYGPVVSNDDTHVAIFPTDTVLIEFFRARSRSSCELMEVSSKDRGSGLASHLAPTRQPRKSEGQVYRKVNKRGGNLQVIWSRLLI